jgi:glycosyltransferase involved in cell wall biosynthesis
LAAILFQRGRESASLVGLGGQSRLAGLFGDGSILQDETAAGFGMSARTDPLWRRLAASLYRSLINARTLGLQAPESASGPQLWYGGARAGKAGGPALKLAKLQSIFPEAAERFNLAYLLSAAPYLSEASFARLKKAGIKSVLNQNGVFYPAWFAGDWQGRNRQMAVAHQLADHVLYQSDFCRKAALRFLGPREGAFEILYNAVDTNAFTPALPTNEAPFLFLVTGKIDAHQAYRATQAVEALALLRAQGLSAGLIVGGILDDDVQAKMDQLLERKDLKDCVLLTGPYSQAEAPTLYRSAQAYLTLTHQDACPSGVIEALASGLPVIHPMSGGVPELAGEAGLAIETGEDWEKPLIPSAQAVAEAMLAAVRNRAQLSRAARERAERLFSFEAWIDRHNALFLELLAKS